MFFFSHFFIFFSFFKRLSFGLLFFFFNDRATTEIYPFPLHDALPISLPLQRYPPSRGYHEKAVVVQGHLGGPHRSCHQATIRTQSERHHDARCRLRFGPAGAARSEEHTSELQSLAYLVCRLLLEKKKK